MTIPKGTFAVTAFLLFPLIVWLIAEPPTFSIMYLAKITGVFGFTAFTLALLLAVRIPLQERIFGDLGRSYRVHQLIGTTALITLFLHPLLLAWSYAQFSVSSAFQLLLPFGETAKIFGIIGLAIMTLCIILTYYIRLPYHIWKTTHKFLSLAFLLGAMHSILIIGDIQTMPLLKLIFLIFTALGVLVIVYRILFQKLFVKRTPYVVTSVNVLNKTFIDVTLTPTSQSISIKPGQFAYITYMSNGVKAEEHPFTIAGPNTDGTIRFVHKILGDFTATLPNIVIGDEALVEGPFGNFSFLNGSKNQCWIAGGIGITPFLAFADHLPADYKATLFYSIRDESENAIPKDLERLSKEKPNLTIIIWNNKERGFLTAAVALTDFDLATVDVFLCGPGPMVTSFRTQLDTLKVPHYHVHQEKFSLKP